MGCSLHLLFSSGAACLFVVSLSLLFDVKSIKVSQLEFLKKKEKSVLSLDPYQTSTHPVQNRKNRKAN